MSIRLRITPAEGDPEEIPLLPTVIRELEQQHGKPWHEIVQLNSEWAFYAAHRYLQIRRNESRPLEEWLKTLDDLQVAKADVDPTSAPDQRPTG